MLEPKGGSISRSWRRRSSSYDVGEQHAVAKAASTRCRKTNLVALIDSLEERGLARRKSTENDRRSHALYLTPKGTALVGRLHRLDATLDERISRTMSDDERRRFCEILRQMASL
jgi:DNA-binding MarR family transcriptional regulator